MFTIATIISNVSQHYYTIIKTGLSTNEWNPDGASNFSVKRSNIRTSDELTTDISDISEFWLGVTILFSVVPLILTLNKLKPCYVEKEIGK